jgi:hypothetical protein
VIAGNENAPANEGSIRPESRANRCRRFSLVSYSTFGAELHEFAASFPKLRVQILGFFDAAARTPASAAEDAENSVRFSCRISGFSR